MRNLEADVAGERQGYLGGSGAPVRDDLEAPRGPPRRKAAAPVLALCLPRGGRAPAGPQYSAWTPEQQHLQPPRARRICSSV